MDGGSDDPEESSSCDLNVSFVLLDIEILAHQPRRIHIVTVTCGHIFHDLNQRLNQTPQIVVTVNLCECAKQSSRGGVPTE